MFDLSPECAHEWLKRREQRKRDKTASAANK
jgi:hypothetical protein